MAVCTFHSSNACTGLIVPKSGFGYTGGERCDVRRLYIRVDQPATACQVALGASLSGTNFNKSVAHWEFWLLVMLTLFVQCYIQSENPKECQPLADDYLECLHKPKEASLNSFRRLGRSLSLYPPPRRECTDCTCQSRGSRVRPQGGGGHQGGP